LYLKQNFCRYRGWDEKGLIKEEKLKQLGL